MAYVLEMLPYPSGEPHIGHLKVYAVGDAVAHFARRNGQPCPASRWATTRSGCRPRTTRSRPGRIRASPPRSRSASSGEQFREWGISIDWTREVSTHDPEYYRWTQWIFLRLYERGLAYRKEAAVKWCPKDQTVLANEQVIDGRCERCGTMVEVRQLEQWFFRITDYADRLLEDMHDDRVAAARGDDAGELDRPLGGRRGGVPLRGARDRLSRSSPRARTRSSARPSSCWRPSTRTCCG